MRCGMVQCVVGGANDARVSIKCSTVQCDAIKVDRSAVKCSAVAYVLCNAA